MLDVRCEKAEVRRERCAKAEGGRRKAEAPAQPTARSGISLIEVLISIGVLALGLLGAAAMFPVGSYYMLKADIADSGAAVGQAAFADLVDRGMLRPEAWQMGTAATYWTQSLPQRYRSATAAQQATFPHAIWGTVYVIDPLGVMAASEILSSAVLAPVVSQLPIVNSYNFNCLSATSPSWQPWNYSGKRYPVRRVSVTDVVPTANVNLNERARMVAEQISYSRDDLAVDLPDQANRPGQLQMDSGGSARSHKGHYSWIATVAPTTFAAAKGLWSGNPGTSLYDVTVAVFYRRPVTEIESARHVKAAVLSTGTSGGQLLLTRFTGGQDPIAESPFELLKVGQYVTLYGPHPQGSNAEPNLFFQWYKVTAIDGEGQSLNESGIPTNNTNELDRRIVSLSGPDWPWRPAGSLTNASDLSNDLRLGIYAGVVAVHTKTMRLSGGSDSGSLWAAPPILPPGTPPNQWVPF